MVAEYFVFFLLFYGKMRNEVRYLNIKTGILGKFVLYNNMRRREKQRTASLAVLVEVFSKIAFCMDDVFG